MEAPYEGPYLVVQRTDKNFIIQMANGRENVVSIDRLKPAKMPEPRPLTLSDPVISDDPDEPEPTETPRSTSPDIDMSYSSDNSIGLQSHLVLKGTKGVQFSKKNPIRLFRQTELINPVTGPRPPPARKILKHRL